MKFLCDRCKTRYSIADERVRGKILKIRCKNCSNVITVREGMPEPEPELPPPGDAPKPALQAAFAQAMKTAAPPQQLEEEWYVSIDGEQSGPFSLAQAQEWVRSKRPDDDLHCWCEGFDDWLPVEKVSHFRGLRVRSAPAKAPGRTPPPAPRVSPKVEEEPKPLFAAALAALEAEVGGGEPRADDAARPRARRQTAGEAAVAEMRAFGEESARHAAASAPAPVPPSAPAVKAQLPPPNRSKPAPVLAKATPSVGMPARPEPAPPTPAPPTNGAAVDDIGDFASDDDLQIGEVSRVVRLQDLVAVGARKNPAAAAALARPNVANAAKVSEAAAPASPLAQAAVESLRDEHGAPAVAAEPGVPALVPVTPPRRRAAQQHMMWIAGAGVALIALVALVIVLATGGDDDEGGGRIGGVGGDVEGLAISVDDPARPWIKKGGNETATNPGKRPGGGSARRPGGGSITQPGTQPGNSGGSGKQEAVIGPDGVPLTPLTPDDVITVAARMSTGTQRCYQRALKDDPFLQVKSIGALISISADGKVTGVSLDQQGASTLGQCLAAAIKRWPFRRSTAGLETKITLKFEQTLR